jgi:hypothetical protein
MRWAKIVLLFQAIITLILGFVFFSQLTVIGVSDISELSAELSKTTDFSETVPEKITEIRTKYTVASYMLLVIGLTEVIIIMRLFS